MLQKLRSSFSKLSSSVSPALTRARETITGVADSFKNRLTSMAQAMDRAANPPALLPYRPENVAWLRTKHSAPVDSAPAPYPTVQESTVIQEEEHPQETVVSQADLHDEAYDHLLMLHEHIEDLSNRLAVLARMDTSYESDRQRLRFELQMKRQELRDSMMPRLGLFADMDTSTLYASLQSRGYRRVDAQDPLHPRLMLALDQAGAYARSYAGDGSLWVHRDVFQVALRAGSTSEHIHAAASRSIREGNLCPIIHLEELMAQMGYDFFPAERNSIMERLCREGDIAPGARYVLKSAQRSVTPRVALAGSAR